MEITDPIVSQMRQAASLAIQNAYCPYSHFPVGAAVLVENGEIFAGCNVENASYGMTICAERNAVFQAVACGHRRIRAVLVETPTELLTPPCGACRQVIFEFAPDADIFVFSSAAGGAKYKLGSLLPNAFGPLSMQRNA